MTEEEFAELAAGHALHALSGDAEQRFQEELAAHPEWAGLVDDDRETMAHLAQTIAPVAPPPGLREQLLRSIEADAPEPLTEASPDAQQASVELASGGQATAHWSASRGEAVLVADGLEAPEDGRTYELWFVRGDTPISAGIFAPEDGAATALLEGEMHAGDVIAVTVEVSGGSPDGVPTTDPIIVIPTA